MRVGLGQDDLLDIPQPFGGEPISDSEMWKPIQPVVPLLKPFQVTVLPPEQTFMGMNANTVLTMGLVVGGAGLLLSLIGRKS